ncbi:MAG: hypothetical protein NVS3B1_28710 [Marmoricola sp.]
MSRRMLGFTLAGVLVASVVTGTGVAFFGQGGPPRSTRFSAARDLIHVLAVALHCQPEIVAGKYAGSGYDRCDVGRSVLYVQVGAPSPRGMAAVIGPGWSVASLNHRVLPSVQAVIGGTLSG